MRERLLGLLLGSLLVILGLTATSRAEGDHRHAAGDAQPGRYLATHHDPWMPNFCHPAIVAGAIRRSVTNGSWHDADVWHGEVPGATDTVVVSTSVMIRGNVEVANLCILPGGELLFDPDHETSLRVDTIQVMPRGRLTIGSASAPVAKPVKIIFRDGAIDLERDPGQYGRGLIVLGRIDVHGRPPGKAFVRLAREAHAGDRELLLSEAAPPGWEAGQRLFLPDTRQQPAGPRLSLISEGEELIAARFDGARVLLTEPLAHDHLGARDATGTLRYLPHAVSLSRNVEFSSDNPDGTRGHIMLGADASVSINGAAFKGLGRTTTDVVDDTVLAEDGALQRVANNQRGRYALHLHHVASSCEPGMSSAKAFRLVNNVIEGAARWGLVIHDSHFGLIENNVIYGFEGAGIVTEDGSESHNVFSNNFLIGLRAGERLDTPIRIREPRQVNSTYGPPPFGGVRMAIKNNIAVGPFDVFDFGFERSGFWARLPHNYYRNNVVTDVGFSSYNFNGYFLQPRAKYPVDCSASGQVVISEDKPSRLLDFSGNEAYASPIGIWVTWPTGDTARIRQEDNVESRFEDVTLWHIHRAGVISWHATDLLFNDIRIIGDAKVSSQNDPPDAHGFDLDSQLTYENGRIKIHNATIHGYNVGISLPYDPEDGVSTTEHVTIVDVADLSNEVNIVERPSTLRYGTKITILKDLTAHPPISTGGANHTVGNVHLDMRYDTKLLGHVYQVIRKPTRTFLVNGAGRSGDIYEVFFREQAPGFKIPSKACGGFLTDQIRHLIYLGEELSPSFSRMTFRGFRYLKYWLLPKLGHVPRPKYDLWRGDVTNADCWAARGLALGGSVAPCADATCSNAIALPGVNGLVFPLQAPPEALRKYLLDELPVSLR